MKPNTRLTLVLGGLHDQHTRLTPVHGGVYKLRYRCNRWLFLRHPTQQGVWCALLLHAKVNFGMKHAPYPIASWEKWIAAGDGYRPQPYFWQGEVWEFEPTPDLSEIGAQYCERLDFNNLAFAERHLKLHYFGNEV